MHPFWAVSDPAAAAIQEAMFYKNLSMLGGALLIAWVGAGPIAMDAWKREPELHEFRQAA
jgi:putative oxidoreductase